MNFNILCTLTFSLYYHLTEGQKTSEHLTLITPKEVIRGQPLKVYFDAPISNEVEYIFKFRDSYIWKKNLDNQNEEIIFEDAGMNFEGIKTFPLSVIATKNDQCITLVTHLTKKLSRGYSFIQTDKPIYKPEDDVKIRLVVLDKNFRPFPAKHVILEVTDSDSNKFEAIKTDVQYDGLYTFKFPLADNVNLGDWQITAKVDNRTDLSVMKYFSVQKYILPLYDVFIETSPSAYFTEGKIPIKIFAKYSFDKYAKGSASIKIRNAESQQLLFSKEINDIKNETITEVDFISHLKLEKSQSNFKINITVDFYDEYSQTSRVKTEQIQLYPERTFNLEIHAGDKFQAGKRLHIDVLLKYPNGELASGNDIVTLDMSYFDSSNHEKHLINNKQLKHGIASFDLQIPEQISNAKITAKYLHYETTKDVRADENIEQGGFFNIILPDEKRKLGQKFMVLIKSDQAMNAALFVIIGRNGIVDSSLGKCYGKTECSATFEIVEEMIPISRINAYNFNGKKNIGQDSARIEFEGLSKNFMKTSFKESKLEPGKYATLKINSNPNSIIGLLAFDKSLTFLRKGNDIVRNDVLTTSDTSTEDPMHVIIDDFMDWRTCTNEEKEDIEKGKVFSIDTRFGGDDFGEFEDDFETNEVGDDPESPVRAGEVRKQFPETWIFETFEIGKTDSIEKKFKLPDTITTWLVSGFSLNPDKGFALADPQELITTQEFFIKMILPYSIRFGEILKIDFVIFNYVKSGSDLSVKLKLFDEDFEIVQLKDPETCEIFDLSSNTENAGQMIFNVQSNSGVTKSFYIRPGDQKKNLNIKIKALATESKNKRKRYADEVEKTLRVIHEGATHYKGEMKTFDFSTQSKNTISGKLEFENAVENSILIHGSITGNIIGPALSIYEEYLVLPDGCAAQTLAKFHKNAHIYRYLKSVPNADMGSLEKSQNLLLSGLQKMNTYVKEDGTYGLYETNPTSIWITAFSAQVFGDANNFFDNIIKNEKLITDALDYCKNHQEPNGFFEFTWYWSDIYYQQDIESENSFDVRHTAFILISFLKNSKFSNRYEKTIEKAFNYLDNNKIHGDSFALAILAYCYALGGYQQEAEDALSKLNQHTNNNGNEKFVNWLDGVKDLERFKIIITSYTALAYINLKQESEAMPYINWLITKRDLQGDFLDDFDTAIATEAITEMARHPRQTNMNVQVENSIGEKVVDYVVTNENALTPYYFEVPKHFSEYKITASGMGKVVVGAFYEFTKSGDILSDTFNLNVQPMKSDHQATIKACVNYKNQMKLNETVIMEFALASGFVYDPQLNDFSQNGIVKNVELKKQNTVVQLHMQGITKQSSCVEVKTQRAHVVAKTKKPFIKVYEYMDKDKFSAHFYSLEPLSCI